MKGRWLTARELQQRISDGLPVELPSFDQNERLDDEEHRQIQAAWIVALVERPKGFIARPVVVRNAIVTGDLNLRYVEFQSDFTFTSCQFKGEVDLSFCIFCKAAVFNGSHFEKKTSMRGVSAHADFEWVGTEFDGELDCKGMTVTRNLCAEGAKFKKCWFQAASIGG